jgi:hypothetical protein
MGATGSQYGGGRNDTVGRAGARRGVFRNITGIAADASGGVVVCEWPANVIRRIRPDGIIETIAGTGENGYSGDGGLAVNAAINWPVTPRFDGKGNLHFGDVLNRRIRRIDTNGVRWVSP